MPVAIPWAFTFTMFLLVTFGVFLLFLGFRGDQFEALVEANDHNVQRLGTLISITSATHTTCADIHIPSNNRYKATVRNEARAVSFGDFSKIDFFARYTTTAGDNAAERLGYLSDWIIPEISPDTNNPDVWDPGETVTIAFSSLPDPQPGADATVAIAVPGGISDSAYFQGAPLVLPMTCLFLHNSSAPPTSDTSSQLVLPMNETEPLVTTLFNYDIDRDSAAGLVVQRGATGDAETDPLKYQAWRTSPQVSDLIISGDASIEFWAGTKNFQVGTGGAVTVFLRDRNATGDYITIASGDISATNWQGTSASFVKKTITILNIDYTVLEGNDLEAKLIVPPTSSGDMWFAYDTVSHPSVVGLPVDQVSAVYFFHSETSNIDGTSYYELKKDIPGDKKATTISSTFSAGQTGRIRPEPPSGQPQGKFVYPLTGITDVPTSTWNVTYRVKRDKGDAGFVWFTNAYDISLGNTGAWQDIILSQYIPSKATGVMVEVVN